VEAIMLVIYKNSHGKLKQMYMVVNCKEMNKVSNSTHKSLTTVLRLSMIADLLKMDIGV